LEYFFICKIDEESKTTLDLTFNYLALCEISERKNFSILTDSCKVTDYMVMLLYDAIHAFYVNKNREKAYSLILRSRLILNLDKELK